MTGSKSKKFRSARRARSSSSAKSTASKGTARAPSHKENPRLGMIGRVVRLDYVRPNRNERFTRRAKKTIWYHRFTRPPLARYDPKRRSVVLADVDAQSIENPGGNMLGSRFELLSNPHGRRMPPRTSTGRFRKRAHRSNPHRRRGHRRYRSNQTYNFSPNPRRRRRSRKNPFFLENRKRRSHRRHRSNPFGLSIPKIGSLPGQVMREVPKTVTLVGGVLFSWVFAKSILNRGGNDRDKGAIGWLANVGGGLVYGTLLGFVMPKGKKSSAFATGLMAGLTAALLRIGTDFLKGKTFEKFGIITGFENMSGYVTVGDFFTLADGAGMNDWLTRDSAPTMAGYRGDTIDRYAGE